MHRDQFKNHRSKIEKRKKKMPTICITSTQEAARTEPKSQINNEPLNKKKIAMTIK